MPNSSYMTTINGVATLIYVPVTVRTIIQHNQGRIVIQRTQTPLKGRKS